jgi:hypothetical protein
VYKVDGGYKVDRTSKLAEMAVATNEEIAEGAKRGEDIIPALGLGIFNALMAIAFELAVMNGDDGE